MKAIQNLSKTSSGFSVIEVLLTLSLLSIAGTMTLAALDSWVPRFDLRSSALQSRSLINKARLEAIQRGVRTVVAADTTDHALIAFADVNGDPMPGNPGYVSYLIYDPDPTLGERQTDYEIGRVQLERSVFGASGFAAVSGFTIIPGTGEEALVIAATGIPTDLGAFRLADATGRNVLEVAVTSLAGQVDSRKFLTEADSPTAVAGFFGEGTDGDGQNTWVWY